MFANLCALADAEEERLYQRDREARRQRRAESSTGDDHHRQRSRSRSPRHLHSPPRHQHDRPLSPQYRRGSRSTSPYRRSRSPPKRRRVNTSRRRSWSRGRSVSSSRSRSPSRRTAAPLRPRERQAGFGLSSFAADDPRGAQDDVRRAGKVVNPDKVSLSNLIRDTMISNRRLDTEQRDGATGHLKRLHPDDLATPVMLMSEHLNAALSSSNSRPAPIGCDAYGRELPPAEEPTYQVFKARKLRELADAQRYP